MGWFVWFVFAMFLLYYTMVTKHCNFLVTCQVIQNFKEKNSSHCKNSLSGYQHTHMATPASIIIKYYCYMEVFSASLLASWKNRFSFYSRCLCFQFKRKNIADHSQWIMLIPDFVAFFFMSLSLFSVESLQHLILRSLNSWNFYLIIQQHAEVKF